MEAKQPRKERLERGEEGRGGEEVKRKGNSVG